MSNVIRPTTTGLFPELPDGLHTVALGNGSQFEVVLCTVQCGVRAVGVVNHGCYVFTGGLLPSYVREKLRVEIGDAENLSDFIHCQIHGLAPEKPSGRYALSLCKLVGKPVNITHE